MFLVAEGLGFLIPESPSRGMPGVIAPAGVKLATGAFLANLLWVVARWRSWNRMGWLGLRPGLRSFGIGLCLGLGMAAAALVLEIILGRGRLTLTAEPLGVYATFGVELLAALAVAALAEELLFRGFPLERLADVMGPVGASLLLASGFAALHAFNPGVTALGLVNIAVASLTLSAVYFRLGGLPAAWGAHLGWNAGLGLGADAPVSGIAFHVPSIEYSTNGPSWLTGGSFGPEGGLIATAVMAAVTVWLGRRMLLGQESA